MHSEVSSQLLYVPAKNEKVLEEEEPIDLGSIGHNLMCRILEKVSFEEYRRFEETSKLIRELASTLKGVFSYQLDAFFVEEKTLEVFKIHEFAEPPFVVHQIEPWHIATRSPVRFQAKNIQFESLITAKRIRRLINLFERSQATVENFYFPAESTFSVEDLEEILTVLKPKSVCSWDFFPKEFFESAYVRQVDKISVDHTNISDEQLCQLKAKYISMSADSVSDRAILKFLMQWKNGSREIDYLFLKFEATANQRDFDLVLSILDANVVWTRETHCDSFVGGLDIEELPFLALQVDVYSISRKNDITNFKVVVVNGLSICVSSCYTEKGYINCVLNEEQYYVVNGTCKDCQTAVCEHWA